MSIYETSKGDQLYFHAYTMQRGHHFLHAKTHKSKGMFRYYYQ